MEWMRHWPERLVIATDLKGPVFVVDRVFGPFVALMAPMEVKLLENIDLIVESGSGDCRQLSFVFGGRQVHLNWTETKNVIGQLI